jgi:hypothetical protein
MADHVSVIAANRTIRYYFTKPVWGPWIATLLWTHIFLSMGAEAKTTPRR